MTIVIVAVLTFTTVKGFYQEKDPVTTIKLRILI